jgi:hypothetical protein
MGEPSDDPPTEFTFPSAGRADSRSASRDTTGSDQAKIVPHAPLARHSYLRSKHETDYQVGVARAPRRKAAIGRHRESAQGPKELFADLKFLRPGGHRAL